MATMPLQELLRDLEALTHDGRMRRMMELGQLAVTDANADSYWHGWKRATAMSVASRFSRVLAVATAHE